MALTEQIERDLVVRRLIVLAVCLLSGGNRQSVQAADGLAWPSFNKFVNSFDDPARWLALCAAHEDIGRGDDCDFFSKRLANIVASWPLPAECAEASHKDKMTHAFKAWVYFVKKRNLWKRVQTQLSAVGVGGLLPERLQRVEEMWAEYGTMQDQDLVSLESPSRVSVIRGAEISGFDTTRPPLPDMCIGQGSSEAVLRLQRLISCKKLDEESDDFQEWISSEASLAASVVVDVLVGLYLSTPPEAREVNKMCDDARLGMLSSLVCQRALKKNVPREQRVYFTSDFLAYCLQHEYGLRDDSDDDDLSWHGRASVRRAIDVLTVVIRRMFYCKDQLGVIKWRAKRTGKALCPG